MFDQVKEAHRGVWASGDYPMIAREIVAPLGEVLTTAARVRAQDLVLDVAAGRRRARGPASSRAT